MKPKGHLDHQGQIYNNKANKKEFIYKCSLGAIFGISVSLALYSSGATRNILSLLLVFMVVTVIVYILIKLWIKLFYIYDGSDNYFFPRWYKEPKDYTGRKTRK